MQWPTEKKDKRTHNDLLITTQKTKEQATETPLNTAGEPRCFGRVCSPCSTSGTSRCTHDIETILLMT
jgi:hypothetical protein